MTEYIYFILNISIGVFVGGCFLWMILPRQKPKPLVVICRIFSECKLSDHERREHLSLTDTMQAVYSKNCPIFIMPFIGMRFKVAGTITEVTNITSDESGFVYIDCHVEHDYLDHFKTLSSRLYEDKWLGAENYHT